MANCRFYPPFNEVEKDGVCVREKKSVEDKFDTVKGGILMATLVVAFLGLIHFVSKQQQK